MNIRLLTHRFHPLYFLLLLIPALLFNCSGPAKQSVERGHDPWVIRSVLDKKARMVTLALAPDFWIAYDAHNGSLYKIWRDGVDFSGPVFNYQHGPQPESQGPAYTQNTFAQPWALIQNGKKTPLQATYKGHYFEGNSVFLNYELATPAGGKIGISENPEYVQSEGGRPGLVRTFETSGVPAGADLVLHVNLSSVPSEKAISAKGGEFVVKEKTMMEHPVLKVYEFTGVLKVNPSKKTVFTTYFNPEPTLQSASEEGQPTVARGLALIEGSDCKTCHNEKSATVGPSYEEVALKYKNNARTVKSLAGKVIKGGTGVWGEQVMTPHPDLAIEDAITMVEWILNLDKDDSESNSNPFYDTPTLSLKNSGLNPEESSNGVVMNVYVSQTSLEGMPDIKPTDMPAFSGVFPSIHFNNNETLSPFLENFAARITGFINIPKTGRYDFATVSDDGSWLYIDGKQVVDNGGFHGADWKTGDIQLTKGEHSFTYDYFQGLGGAGFSFMWMPPDAEDYTVVPPEVLLFDKKDLRETLPIEELLGGKIPGDGSPLEEVHPSFDLSTARPPGFEPKVGGLDFLPDGRLVVSSWDPDGGIYLLDNVETGDSNKIKLKQIASGLAEPLGVKVVDGEIYVLQKQELTHLVDNNGDDIIDEYRTICAGWKVSANFHEFAFGLVYKDGYFYATLATAIEPGGKSTQPQIPDRGKVVKISKADGSFEFIAHGLRTPNGIGLGFDNEIFVADNQGDWLPSSKIVHIKPGAWYGSRSVDFEGTKDLEETLPVAWLPQDEIGNSPSQPAKLDVGPYKGQMIHGEVTHGGLKRVFVENVEGQYQGALFRFTQGLEGGVNRVVWGPDGSLYVGCVGNPGNWGHAGKKWYGLQRLTYNEKPTFEMLAIRAKSKGIEIEFTEPLALGYGISKDDYEIRQWYYKPTVEYGGPKINDRPLNIRSINMSTGRRRVYLELDGMKEGHVVYVRLRGPMVSEENRELWNREAWYTLNKIPKDASGFANEIEIPARDNMLTEAEKNAGWMLLFDGKTTNGWRNYNKETIGSSWRVQNGTLALTGPKREGKWFVDGGDIVTEQPYENFELKLDWKISKAGNSGIIYNVVEDKDIDAPWRTGPEMQILDNNRHPDGRIRSHRAGDLYDMIECRFTTVKPPEEWNHIRLIVNRGIVQHWQNGYKVVEYDMNSDSWPEMIANSKFKDMPHFGKSKGGHICLQDHSDVVSFKNIKIRLLDKPL